MSVSAAPLAGGRHVRPRTRSSPSSQMLGACASHSSARSKRSARIGSDGVGANSGMPRLLFYEGIRRLTSARWEHHRCLDLASGGALAGEVLVLAYYLWFAKAGRRGGLGFRQDVRCVVMVSVQLARLSFLVLARRCIQSTACKTSGEQKSQGEWDRRKPASRF